LGDIVCGVGEGGTGMNTGPDSYGTKVFLLFLSRRSVGEEARGVDGRLPGFPSFDQIENLGIDSVPDIIEWGVKYSTKRLDRGIEVSAGGLGIECRAEVQTVITSIDIDLHTELATFWKKLHSKYRVENYH
jgi:hypothetical protein